MQSYTASYNNAPIYSFNITSFAPNGNVLAATDTANGNWNYSYDQFNRLVCADLASNGTCTTPPTGTPTYTYVYDRFGNRWQQNGPHTFIASFTGNSSTNNNRMDGYSYDAAGNLMNDGTHQYTYDAENRIISVDNGNTATYAYDPDGHRVEKISTVGNGGDPPGTWQFLYDQSGRMVKRFEGALWKGETYAGARHLATLGAGTEFSHADWLGTERVRTGLANSAWKVCESIASLPFGDGQTTTGVCYQSSPLHFTGKFRDSDSGLDNFGARFDASSFGRFTSPDPDNAGADDGNPQSWNAYAYVVNNPLSRIDPDGLADCGDPDPYKCTVKADPPAEEVQVSYSWRVIWENAGRVAQQTNDLLRTAWDFWSAPRNMSCLVGATTSGFATGFVAGGTLGLAGGPFDEVTVPGGAAVGGIAGTGAGWTMGMAACRTGMGSGGGGNGGGGRASGREARLTRPQQRQTAKYLGMKEVKGVYSGGELVFEKDGRYFSFSNTSHTAGEVFKEVDRNGNRIATTDLNLNRIGQ